MTGVEPEGGVETRSWPAVMAIAASTFSLVTAEFLPVGLLNGIAADLTLTIGTAGFIVAVTGLFAAVAGPVVAIVAGHRNRRAVLLTLTALVLLSNLLSFIASEFVTLLTARVLLGIALGGFWSLGVNSAARIVGEAAEARAVSIVYAGISMGIVFGVPLGTLIGQMAGWRTAFGLASFIAGLALIAQLLTLPRAIPATRVHIRDIGKVLMERAVRQALALTFLAIGAQFATYTYIEPFMLEITQASSHFVAAGLLIYGSSGILGSFLGGYGASRSLRNTLSASLGLAATALASLYVWGASVSAVAIALSLWGIAFGGLPLCLRLWVTRSAKPYDEAASALFVTVVQISVAAGSAAGGQIVNQLGVSTNLSLGAIGFIVAIIFSRWLVRKPLSRSES